MNREIGPKGRNQHLNIMRRQIEQDQIQADLSVWWFQEHYTNTENLRIDSDLSNRRPQNTNLKIDWKVKIWPAGKVVVHLPSKILHQLIQACIFH